MHDSLQFNTQRLNYLSNSDYTMFRYLSFLVFFYLSNFIITEAAINYSNGNIKINWDVMNWTPDGYVGVVTINNFQTNRSIRAPGWELGWTWARKEIIWTMLGAQTTDQGDCSHYKGNIPHSCMKSPTIVDLLPRTPYNQRVKGCCRGGVLGPWSGQYRGRSKSVFEITVGRSGYSNTTVKLPKNFTFKAPGDGYSCGLAKIVTPTKFITADKRRSYQALMTWDVTCAYAR